jgi:hypothetical protein
MATLHKTKPQEYEVKHSGQTIGWFYRYYQKSTGRWAANYVGHSPGKHFWAFEPTDVDSPGFFDGVSFAEGKSKLMVKYPD